MNSIENKNQERILETIIGQALAGNEPHGMVKTSVVHLHLSQMREWGARGGAIQLKAIQDYNGIRKEFVQNIVKENRIKQRLDYLLDNLVCRGEILWLMQPSDNKPTGYSLNYYVGGKFNPRKEYEVFYSDENTEEIECVAIVTKHLKRYNTRYYPDESSGFLNSSTIGAKQYYYKVTFITTESFIVFTTEREPKDLEMWYRSLRTGDKSLFSNNQLDPVVTPNWCAPNFPFAICKNIEGKINESGHDDFYPVDDLIEEHNSLLLSASENLAIFNTPTLVTSRDASSVLETIQGQENNFSNYTWAGQNGYKTTLAPYQRENYRIPKVIGSIRDGERFGYVQSPDVISGDQNLYIRQIRELIHWMLGGVDPLGISANATFGEIKSLFGRIENTSKKKMEAVLGENGLCKLLALAIFDQETKGKIAITKFLMTHYRQLNDQILQQLSLSDDTFRDLFFYITQELKLQIPGMPCLGKRDCSWRYTKKVYEDTTREQLDSSIVYRNNREDGISQEEALRNLYPNMSDDEIRQSMSGFSPRVVTQALEGIQAAFQLYTMFSQTPDPEDPRFSWESRLQTYKIVEQAMLTLQKEVTYNLPDYKQAPDYNKLNETLQNLLEKVDPNVRTKPTTTTAPPQQRQPVPVPSATMATNTTNGRQ